MAGHVTAAPGVDDAAARVQFRQAIPAPVRRVR